MKENIIQLKTYNFATKIITLHQLLATSHQYELGSQVLRSGTSIGANVEESIGGQSRRDFLNKISIAYKEARETRYWLRLFTDCNIISEEIGLEYLTDIEEIIRILGSIQKTIRDDTNS